MRSIEFATKPMRRGKFTVKIIFFDATIGSTPSVKSTRGVSFQRTEDSQSAFSPFYSKVYFTMNSLQLR